MKDRSSSIHNRGFTLLELIVALLIVSIVGAAIFSTLRTAFRAKTSAEEAVEPLQRAGVVLDFLRRDLESALPPMGVPAAGAPVQHFSQSFVGTDGQGDADHSADDVLLYAAVEAGPVKTALEPQLYKIANVRQIEYAVISQGKDRLLVRYVTSNLLAQVIPDPEPEVLCRGVRSFNLRYSDGTNWYDSWDSTQTVESIPVNMLPAMVQVTLELESATPGGAPLHFERLISLPCSTVAAAISAASGGMTGGGG
ncbi:MAG: type II secretion system protein GspJ [Phycisphaerae bacterium]